MKNIVTGDTIVFEANLTDVDGTAITNAAGTITVVDAAGSTVLAAGAAHTSAGTYQKSQATAGWGNGPITEYWRFTNAAGTTTKIVGNQFRIIGTATLQPYVWPHELFAYYENVEDYFDGSELERVWDSYNFVNQQLEGLGYKLPVAKGTDGYYDQALRDWNAYDAVYRIVTSRAVSRVQEGEGTPWFDYYKREAAARWNDFRTKKIVLNKQTTPGESGILPGTKIAGTLYGQMETNWEGYGRGFRGEDFPRTWRVNIIGTGTAGGHTEGTFRWSRDDGASWEGTGNVGTGWMHLTDEVYVRFHRGTNTGTEGNWTTADIWQWKTAPVKNQAGGKGFARSY